MMQSIDQGNLLMNIEKLWPLIEEKLFKMEVIKIIIVK